ncbi:MAG: hypothetical protein ACRDNS_20560, partial [Trebonia sp.]
RYLRSRKTDRVRNRRWSQYLIAAAAAACALVLAACGSSGSPTAASLSPRLEFAKCMRSHGVPNFPDGPNIPDTVGNSPAFKAASQVCVKKYLYRGGGPHGGVSESTRLSLLHHAECMRAHGVPNYPDPTISSHGPYSFGPPPGVDTNAPAFQRAASACGGP